MTDKITQYLADKFGLPYITAQFLLCDWEISEYPAFSTITQGNEVHVLLNGKFMPRDGFRDVFGPLIKQYGKAVTRVQLDDVASQSFVERIGFRLVRADAHFVHYEINHIPFQDRRPSCQ